MEQHIIDRGSETAGQHTDLIASNRVEGTAVYSRSGDRLGEISHFMVGKRSGKVDYAVLSFGGFMGIGEDHFPLPWDQLDYDVEKGGYVVDVTKEQLNGAPRYEDARSPDYDRGYYAEVSRYYGSPFPY